MSETRETAVLYRMVMPNHVCPYGLKSKALLGMKGFDVEDHWLETREETDAFLEEHNVKTSPQTWINGERVGGYDDLRDYFDIPLDDPDETTFQPVIAIFSVALLMSLAVTLIANGTVLTLDIFTRFIAIAMVLLGIQKLQDVEQFSTMFLGYDLLARKWVPYAYIYPFAETLAGLLMIAAILPWLSGPIALFIGGVGAASVFKAVYIDKRELKCACVGGGSNVPLGFVSLTENVMMLLMGIITIASLF
ncbi:glutaredoxin [Marivivens donghaensis]|uniref:Methylamine utilization protein MauE n=1 Tax=Marivivens donghaensis TaxID=1699413 RepID=A0ABX0W4G8_9RHOB|nr:glutaredoxin [Marivivens donghaensis]NIY73812.1 glutaredoxin [Marivivens donghaensis]